MPSRSACASRGVGMLVLFFAGACTSAPPAVQLGEFGPADSSFDIRPSHRASVSSQPYSPPRSTTFNPPLEQVSILGALRELDDANVLEKMNVGGIEYNELDPEGWGFGLEAGLWYGLGDDTIAGVESELSMLNLTVGARYTYTGLQRFLPYVGIGVDGIAYQFEVGGVKSGREYDVGFYAHAGANYVLTDTFQIGVDVRTTLETDDGLDYYQAALAIGWAF